MMRDSIGGRAIGRGARASRISRLADAAGQFEPLEPRQLLTVNILDDVGNRTASSGASATVIDLAGRYDNPDLTGSIYRFNSVLGAFHIEMFDAAGQARTRTTPQTVANFNQYVTNNRYTNSFIHRSVPNFVLQGGGYTAADLPTLFQEITAFPPVVNEPGNTNIRGTIAMAKLGSSPNSATSQWFINLGNNAANLDNQNGGFTAFGRVIGNGMTVVDALAAIPNYPFGSPFDNVPLRNYTQQDFNNEVPPRPDHLVLFSTIEQVSELTYTVTSTNTALVNPVIVGNRLVLNHGAGMTGSANVTVRITAADGSFVDDTFSVNVSNPVAPANLAVTPVRVTAAGNAVTLTATGPGFANPSINNVKFYRDINNNGVRDTADLANGLIDIDDDGSDGYSTVVPFSGMEFAGVTGGQLFFAIGFIDGTETGTIAFAAASFNRAPTVGFLSLFPPSNASRPAVVANLGDNLQMDALNVFDLDGTIARVQFFRDANGNGIFDSGTDVFLGEDTTPNNGFRLTTATTGFPTGVNTAVFAIATDNEGQTSAPETAMIRVNAAPVIGGGLTFSTMSLTRGQSLTLTANMVTDLDSGNPPTTPRVQKVDFFRDSNGNGTFETATDQFLGSAVIPASGTTNYSITVSGAITAVFPAGDLLFFARPADNDFAFGAVVQATVTVINQAPTLSSVSASPSPVANLGGTLTLTASGAADSDGNIVRVEFYRDANSNGVFDLGTDTLLGQDTTPSNGFSLAVNTGTMAFGFTIGSNTIFAVAVDNDGSRSAAASRTARVNAPPTIGSVTVSPDPIFRNGEFTLTANTVADTGEMGAGGNIARVEFYRDTNSNGVLDVGTDQLLGSDTSASGGYTLTRTATGLSTTVPNIFFARVVDSENGVSTAVMVAVNAINSPPTISGVTTSASTLAQRGLPITLTASGAADVDGTIARVLFYRDDGDGIFDAMTDTLLGEDDSASGGYKLIVDTGDMAFGFTTGLNTVFAVPEDDDGVIAAVAASRTFRINATPTLGTFTVESPVGRGNSITLTVEDVEDQPDSEPAGSVSRVEFFRDVNDNGVFDEGVDRLIGTGRRQSGTNTFVLTTRTRGFDAGTLALFVRARDNHGGFSDAETGSTMIVNNNPTLTGVRFSPRVPGLGSILTLSSVGQRDTDGSVASVWFYLDADGNGLLDEMVDTLLGGDDNSSRGFTLDVDTSDAMLGFAPGPNTFFAKAIDNDGGESNIVAITGRINAAPTVGMLVTDGPVTRGGTINLTASDVTDDAEPGVTGTIRRVEFFVDSNENGVFDAADRRVGASSRATAGEYTARVSTRGFPGMARFFARAIDNDNGAGTGAEVAQADAAIVNNNPTLSSVRFSPTIQTLGGMLTLSVSGARDVDGSIDSVWYYRDADGNGLLDEMVDTLLGGTTSASGGFRMMVDTGDAMLGFDPGMNTLFAKALDNEGDASNIVATTGRLNAAPTIGGLSFDSDPVLRNDSVTATVSDVLDNGEMGFTGAVRSVQLFRDVNNNGIVDREDRRLGNARQISGTDDYALTFSTRGFDAGDNTILAVATDNNRGTSDVFSAIKGVTNLQPFFSSTRVNSSSVAFIGQSITIAPIGARDLDGAIVQVLFFLETTGDNTLDPMNDLLIGEDNSSSRGWALTVPTLGATGFMVGDNRVYACIIDNDGGNAAIGQDFTIAADNMLPTVGSVVGSPAPVQRGDRLALVAMNLDDADGTVRRVEFFRDTNGNGVLDEGVDEGLGAATVRAGQAVLNVRTSGFDAGDNTILARAIDDRTATGATTAGTVAVTNQGPTISSFTDTRDPVIALGQMLRLSANGVRDRDGTIQSVEFYFDVNGDGLVDMGDTLLGTGSGSGSTFRLEVDTGDMAFGFTPGTHQFIVVVTDSDGDSTTASTTTRFNAAPGIADMDVVPNGISRSGTFSVTVTGVTDDQTVRNVYLYFDSNGNDLFDDGDRRFGSARRVAGTDDWTYIGSGRRLPAGTYKLFARARDNNGVYSEAAFVAVTVT